MPGKYTQYGNGVVGGGVARKKEAVRTTLTKEEATKAFNAADNERTSWSNEHARLTAQFEALHSNRSLAMSVRLVREEELKARIATAYNKYLNADNECRLARVTLRKATENEPILAREKQEQEAKEANLKATIRRNFIGSDEEFNSMYPELRLEALKQHTLSNTDLGKTPAALQREQMLARFNNLHSLGEV